MKKSTIYFIIILLIFSLQLKPDTYLGKLPELLKPGQIVLSDELIYITDFADGRSIYIYERKNLKFFKKFGKEGQGPEEFPKTLSIKYYKKKIFVSAFGKYLWFDEKGNFIKENRKNISQIFLYPIHSGYVCSEYKFFYNKNYIGDELEVNLYDTNLKSKKTLLKKKSKFSQNEKTLTVFPKGTFVEVDNDIIYIGTPSNKKGLVFDLYNYKGNQIETLNIQYKKVQIPNSYKTSLLESSKKNLKGIFKQFSKDKKYSFPEYFPPFRFYKVDNSFIYIFRDIPNFNYYQLMVIDTKGLIKNKLLINKSIKKYYIFHGNLYYLAENEDTEEWQLYSKKLL